MTLHITLSTLNISVRRLLRTLDMVVKNRAKRKLNRALLTLNNMTGTLRK